MNNRAIVLLFSVAVLVLYLLIVPSEIPLDPPSSSDISPQRPPEYEDEPPDGANEDYHYPESVEDGDSDPEYYPPNDESEHKHEFPEDPSSIPIGPEDNIPATSPPTIPSDSNPPTNPTIPTENTLPTENPTIPTNPTENTPPTETIPPIIPTDPNPPTNPTDPTNPTNPTDPINTTKPTNPTDTTVPTSAPPPPPPTTPTTPQPLPSSSQRVPRIKHIEITAHDNDTSSSWLDDDGSMRFVTLLYKPDIDTLQALRRLLGSIHYFEHEKIRMTIFGLDVPSAYYEEVRTYSFARYISLPPSDAGNPENFVVDHVLSESKVLYGKFLFVPLSERVMLNGEGLAKLIQENPGTGPIRVTLDSKDVGIGYIRGDGTQEIGIDGSTYFTRESKDEFGRCTLLRNITSPFRTRFVYAHDNHYFGHKEDRHDPDDRLVCLAIATYSGGNTFDSLDEFSLFKFVLPSFLESTRDVDTPNSRYRFAFYLGTQPDALYDDQQKLQEIQEKFINTTSDRAFSLRMFWTPLIAPAMDIAYKWNALIDQSYRDGCDYIYQYSDDTLFSTPWVDQFIRYLEAESNFGVVGATDPQNMQTMTLSFAHRSHITILGSYWPTHLKNWFSDDWAQHVYGQRYTYRSKDVLMSNTQQHGQRYPACGHDALFQKLMQEESRPRIIEWLKKQPQTYDIRQKLYYFEYQHAEGEKK